jgi:transcriptional regulator with XRE-family HTH domain
MMQTRLAEFMAANDISRIRLAVRAGISVQHVGELKAGRSDPRRPTMNALARSARSILRRRVRVTELFDLGDGEN